MKIKFFALIILLELLFILPWSTCNNFISSFHFIKSESDLRLDDYIHNDKGVDIMTIRIFHNKAVQYSLDIFDSYLKYWDWQFLIDNFSLTGTIGLISGLWFLINEKIKIRFYNIFIFLLFINPFLEIFIPWKIPFLVKILYLNTPRILLSIYGWNILYREYKKGNLLLNFLLYGSALISIWYFVIIDNVNRSYCS